MIPIILLLLALIYILTNFVLPNYMDGFVAAYIVQPILWTLLAITALYAAKQRGLNILKFQKIRRWDIGKSPLQAAMMIAAFQISLTMIAGIFQGFGKSPYSFTPLFIITNIIFIATMLLGTELSRSYIIKKSTSASRKITLKLTLITLILMMINIKIAELTTLNTTDPATLAKFIGENIIPLLTASLFATYLAYLGGALPAIGYMGTLQAFEWFSPILPKLDWSIAAMIATLAPAIGFIIIQSSIEAREKHVPKRKTKKDPALGWTAVAAVGLVIVFFSYGYLGAQPTIIYSGSMQPAINVGDVVIIQKTPADEIRQGDIIQYVNKFNTTIIHRVQEIKQQQDSTVYITKGDANDDPDFDPVQINQIQGKATFNIPKIGLIPIVIKELVKKIPIRI